MKPKFTSAQLTKQRRWKHEENFTVATQVVNALPWLAKLLSFLWIPIIGPFLIPLGMAMVAIDAGLRYNKNKILSDEQKELNAENKELLLKKDNVLKQLATFDESHQRQEELLSKPSNINYSTLSHKVGAITKKRHINTTLIKPTNVLFNSLKKDIGTPTNIDVYKR